MGRNSKQRKTTERLIGALLKGRASPERLRVLSTQQRAIVIDVLEAEFELSLKRTWSQGWLPGEIMRQVRRTASPSHAHLLGRAIAAHHQQLDPAEVHPRWQEHFASLKLARVLDNGWLWNLSQQTPWVELLSLAIETLIATDTDSHLETIIPAPGAELTTESIIKDRVPSTDPVLEKVRNLLAQAESTRFDAEAEAFTAKAQEMMAKHSINEALVWSRSGSQTEPTIIRIAIDEPYIRAKRYLVHVVAQGSNCRSVFSADIAMSSIVGFEVDVYATETLFTSLLVQAQSSMQRASTQAPPGSRSRSRGFRSSFLIGYATRIGERLAEINAHVNTTATATNGDDLLPVLTSRNSAVDAAVDDWFPGLVTSSIRGGTDIHGHLAGQQAANLAKLSKPLAA